MTIVKGEDAGEYEARAENSMGTASTKSTVKVNSEYMCIHLSQMNSFSFWRKTKYLW